MSEDKDAIIKDLKGDLKVRMDCQINQVKLIQEKDKQIEGLKKKMNENEAKEQAREKKGNLLDSYTIGSAVKEGAWKVYFSAEEEMKKATKDTKVAALLKLKQGIEGL